MIDPTIAVDGVTYWEHGTLMANRLPRGAGILQRYSCTAGLFRHPDREIGLAVAA